MVILGKVYLKNKVKKKPKRITVADFTKKQRKYFGSLNPRRISFWKNISSEKREIRNKITLADKKENTIFEDHLVSEELKKFSENATKGLQVNETSYILKKP